MRDSEGTTTLTMLVCSGYLTAALSVVYALVLIGGLSTLPTPDHQVQDPWFTAMELLILAIAPAMVCFAVAVHERVGVEGRAAATLAVAFMSMCAAVTCCVHFAVLTLSRHPAIALEGWVPHAFGFSWPSAAYALDILAWDYFFPLAAFFLALALRQRRIHRTAQLLCVVGAVLSFAGVAGVPLEDMAIRNVGILGYVLLFPMAAAMIAHQSRPHARRPDHSSRAAGPDGPRLRRER